MLVLQGHRAIIEAENYIQAKMLENFGFLKIVYYIALMRYVCVTYGQATNTLKWIR